MLSITGELPLGLNAFNCFIKPKEISTAFENQLKTEIRPSQIILKTDINKVGNYSLEVNLYPEVSSIVKIKVDKLSSIKS